MLAANSTRPQGKNNSLRVVPVESDRVFAIILPAIGAPL
jgi:hypothetical protein